MFKDTHAFSSFSVNDLAAAKTFYGETLGLEVEPMSIGISISIADGGSIFVYPKSDHVPATFTVLNFPVANIDDAVDQLIAKGVTFEQYDGPMGSDEKGICRPTEKGHGPTIAWFKDPAGNFLAVMEEM